MTLVTLNVFFIDQKTLNYLAFQSFYFKRTWWRLWQKLVVCATLDIYVFIKNNSSIDMHITTGNLRNCCRRQIGTDQFPNICTV